MGLALRVPDLSFADANLGTVTRGAVSAPSITISNFVVSISAESGATIKYTTNGNTPTASSGTTYSSSFTPSANCTIKAVAIKDGETSAVSSVNYVVQGGLTQPTITENGNTITMSAPSGYSIYYTTDGSEPTTSSTKYTSPLTITASVTIKAKSFDASGNYSQTYTFEHSGTTINFADSAVKQVLLDYGIGSDGEITKEQAAAVTQLPSFTGNTEITSFNELKYFTNVKKLEDPVDAQKKNMFNGCTNLTSIDLTNITNLDNNGIFASCTSLATVVWGNNLTSMNSSYLFRGCSSLNINSIPANVTKIGSYAFENCTSITSMTFNNKLTVIGSASFMGCTNLRTIVIPSSVTEIGMYAFRLLSNLECDIELLGCTKIGNNAFQNTKIGNVKLPDSVITVTQDVTGIFPTTASFKVSSQSVKDLYVANTYWASVADRITVE